MYEQIGLIISIIFFIISIISVYSNVFTKKFGFFSGLSLINWIIKEKNGFDTSVDIIFKTILAVVIICVISVLSIFIYPLTILLLITIYFTNKKLNK